MKYFCLEPPGPGKANWAGLILGRFLLDHSPKKKNPVERKGLYTSYNPIGGKATTSVLKILVFLAKLDFSLLRPLLEQ